MNIDLALKQCRICLQGKLPTEFPKHPDRDDGYLDYCKDCQHLCHQLHAAYLSPRRQREDAYREEVRAKWRADWRKHKEQYRPAHNLRNHAYYKTHSEELKAYIKQWRKQNPEKCKEMRDHWNAEHPDRAKQFRSNANRRRTARLAAAEMETIDAWAIAERENWHCHICHRLVSKKRFTLDHLIPVSRGGPHVAWNLALAHHSCNARRGPGRIPGQLRLPLPLSYWAVSPRKTNP